MTQPNNRGGYRSPSSPANVSGPGKMARRTDQGQPLRNLTDAQYGEQQSFRAMQSAAPIAQAGKPGEAPPMAPVDMSGVVPFDAPTQFPNEPITAGADIGPGPGSAVLPQKGSPAWQSLVEMLPTLEIIASSPESTPEMRDYYRMVRGMS